jgi:hypothetical protein
MNLMPVASSPLIVPMGPEAHPLAPPLFVAPPLLVLPPVLAMLLEL